MKLISMTEFVLEQNKLPFYYYDALWTKVINYANFLKQPLELWMFVPCDEDGNVVEEPKCSLGKECASPPCVKYQQTKGICLFEGFEYQKQGGEYLVKFDNNPVWVNWNNSKTIEDLIYLKPKLTPTALKQIGL